MEGQAHKRSRMDRGEEKGVDFLKAEGDERKDLLHPLSPASCPGMRLMEDLELKSMFECPVCRQLFYDPVTLNCGHSLCEECMMGYLEKAAGRCKCPAGCQTMIPFQLPPINVTLRQVLQGKFPEANAEREREVSEFRKMRRERLEHDYAICKALSISTEGERLERIRRDIRIARRQDQRIRRRSRRIGTPRFRREQPDCVFKIPISTAWMMIILFCTLAAALDEGFEMGARLDTSAGTEYQYW
eukprot:CAMPEP_0167761352 /NCGR_PEP_ID=MMETSP0110_2-20121227/12120_1 /TAXON_ID=629695 /ORGANISM="Gymnochlora sp., Strain CCMP2014" /LENGTH=243 /DNA_ID=CAMNT_0007648017 /DNA_START=38 /DNA_END=766 /DNA_ORIENTATION=+